MNILLLIAAAESKTGMTFRRDRVLENDDYYLLTRPPLVGRADDRLVRVWKATRKIEIVMAYEMIHELDDLTPINGVSAVEASTPRD